MRSILRIYGFLVVLFGLPMLMTAYNIQKIDIKDGLSNNNVISISQDRDGFIWVATKDGLNRFDNSTFKIFRHSPDNPNSILSNTLNCLYADKFDDIIWVGTEKNGLSAYNYKTHQIKNYVHDYSGGTQNSIVANGVTDITADQKGNLWIATYMSGIDYFDKETQTFKHYSQSNIKGLGSDYNWCIYYESDEAIYAGHVKSGFSIINLTTRTAMNFKHDPNDPSSLPENTVTSIYKDSQNHVWIGTRNGLTWFDPVTHEMRTFQHDPDNPASISNNYIQSITESMYSKLWIGTEGGGVNILDLSQLSPSTNPASVEFEHIDAAETPDALASPSSHGIFQDSFGNMWIGGYAAGLNFIPKQEPFFKQINYLPIIGNENSLSDPIVAGLSVGNDGELWVANSLGGINAYLNNNKILENAEILGKDQSINANCILYHKNKVWFASGEGEIFVYNKQTGKTTKLDIFPELKTLPIYKLYIEGDNLWICTDIGLANYNLKTKEQIFYSSSNTAMWDGNVRCVIVDKNDNIWVGTLGGELNVFTRDFKLLYKFGNYFNFYSINQLYEDSKGRMWVGSQNDLFLFLDYDHENVIRIGKDQGLAETDVRALMEGTTADDLWLSTINGISHVSVADMEISNYNVNDDIAFGDYLKGSVTKTKEGNIYFGSQNGITWFNEDGRGGDTELSKTLVTNFLVTNHEQNINEFEEVPYNGQVVLKYQQNSFQIHFNVIDYALAHKVEFAFQMKGLDDNWYLIKQDKHVTFRNLKPGNYTFQLKTRQHNKDWAEQTTMMAITIKPPMWLAWWAKGIYMVVVIIIVIYLIRFVDNKIKVENDLLLEKKVRQQEHELHEEKIKFFTNITHELRTPMTLVLGPLEDLMSDPSLSPSQSRKINSIHRVANRLLLLINQILEFRKSENKNRQLRVMKDDFSKHVYDIGQKYMELNQNSKIDFQIVIPDEEVEMFYDPEVISIILDNLLSNAFKYTREGSIIMELRMVDKDNIRYTQVSVSDSGYGISASDLPHIFERYYQAKNVSHPIKGTGIGLSLVKNLVELHEGEIKVTSKVNEGSTFRVQFITNNSYPDVEHFQREEMDDDTQEEETNSKDVILIVDDNQEIINYISDSLIDTYDVLYAENGKIGFDKACERIPNLVISDVMMPVMDGIEMLRLMKKDVRTSHIPVVLLTAKGAPQDQREGYDSGADSYLTKPFSTSLLRSRIRNILETRKKLSKQVSSNFKDKKAIYNESTNQLDKEFLDKLTQVIEDNLEDEDMNISQIASKLNMSHSTLYRKIKALTNLTANEFIRKVRINVAEQLLVQKQYTISEIMYRIGINSSSYFRQCFKDEFGMNPSDYLNKLKES